MARNAITGKRTIGSRAKVKTGCATCRIRKVKCDETKPFCQKCVKTGRTCDGYESPFRPFNTGLIKKDHVRSSKSGVGSQPNQPAFMEIAPRDIDLLNRYFSTKTLFDVELGCDEEARQILQASLTDPPVRNAILSLRALREDLETSGDGPDSGAQQTPGYHYGLHQYNMALRGLAFSLSSPGSNVLKSSLLCCQIFISIEQAQKNYAAMAEHIVRGLRIMHEYRARPQFVDGGRLVAAHPDRLPCLDVFIIKLFSAPCKFAEPPATSDIQWKESRLSVITPHQQPVQSRDRRTLAPAVRKELMKIAASTLEFLSKASQVESADIARQLLSEKASLLDSLDSWLIGLDRIQKEAKSPSPEPIAVSFLRLFQRILRVILLGSLESSLELNAKLRTENDRLQSEANSVGERLRTYKMCSGTSNSPEEQSTVR